MHQISYVFVSFLFTQKTNRSIIETYRHKRMVQINKIPDSKWQSKFPLFVTMRGGVDRNTCSESLPTLLSSFYWSSPFVSCIGENKNTYLFHYHARTIQHTVIWILWIIEHQQTLSQGPALQSHHGKENIQQEQQRTIPRHHNQYWYPS